VRSPKHCRKTSVLYPPASFTIHLHVLQSCKKMGKSVGRGMCPPASSEGVTQPEVPTSKRPEAVRVWLLGDFRVSVGSGTIEQNQ
jgi:hypothetical protein